MVIACCPNLEHMTNFTNLAMRHKMIFSIPIKSIHLYIHFHLCHEPNERYPCELSHMQNRRLEYQETQIALPV